MTPLSQDPVGPRPGIPHASELTPEQCEKFVDIARATGVILVAPDVAERLPATFTDALRENGIGFRIRRELPPGVVCALNPRHATLDVMPTEADIDEAIERFTVTAPPPTPVISLTPRDHRENDRGVIPPRLLRRNYHRGASDDRL